MEVDEKKDRAIGRPYVPPGLRSAEPPKLDFPPIRNGVDYLVSVIDHLDEAESSVDLRDIKYAVLHLQAAAEVLLKARLQREHWSLVFKDPGQATQKRYQDADFESCTTDAAVERLRRIVGIAIDDKDHRALKDLAKDRNALQHYGLTHNAEAVEARAGTVLDFLVRFLDEELLPLLNDEERDKIPLDDMVRVREGVNNIASYIRRRMDRLSGTLKEQENRTVHCADCDQWALILTPERGECLFCGAGWPDAGDMAVEYLYGHPDVPDIALWCPQCETQTLVDGIEFKDTSPHGLMYCFTCATRFGPTELARCAGCSRPWPVEGNDDGTASTLCQDCRYQNALAEETA
ncbi:hypothetical protein ACWGI8_41660 [Streptomyces sp. NPDC054841]